MQVYFSTVFIPLTVAQNIPIDTFPFPYEQVYATGTDALVFLTVYPRPTPWSITDADIEVLTKQMADLNKGGRRVLLRFAPEMNGNWNYWGQQPTRFLALWGRVYRALAKDAPLTSMVWAPSSGNGYPYGGQSTSAEDVLLLDTNKDGVVNALDDPYLPYYPGDNMVDWVGLSIYYYGIRWPWVNNELPGANVFETILNEGDFYNTYSTIRQKPFMLAETAASFHVDSPTGPGPGHLVIAQAFWRQYLTNRQTLNKYPKLKLVSLFEFQKVEEGNNH
jgi:hypothetical protein